MTPSQQNILAVAAGGAAGAVSRVLGNAAVTALVPPTPFPWGILVINILGGFAMGLLQGRILRSGSPHTLLYSLLGTGFLGGFTTVSSFAIDTYTLYAQSPVAALVNIAANVLLCLAAAGAGFAVSGARLRRA